MNYKELKAKQEEELNSFSKGNIIVILASSDEEIAANKDEINKAIADYRKEFYEHN